MNTFATLASVQDVTAGAAATLVLAGNGSPRRVHLKALATNTQPIRVGDALIAANRGTQLRAGDEITFHTNGSVYAIREASGTVDVTVSYEERPS